MVPSSLKADASALQISWPDGLTARLPWSLLRKRCPCAICRQSKPAAPASPQGLGGLPVLSPAEARPTTADSMQPVGNYGYRIRFSDGHTDGIYSLDLLRSLSEEVAGA